MGDIRQKAGADFAGDLSHALEIDDARIGTGPHRNHLRLVLASHAGQLIVIDPLILFPHAVVHNFEELSREIRLVAMRQVAAVAQIHGEHLIARLQEGEIDRHVGAAARMGLDVGVVGAEELPRPVDRELLDHIDVFTASVPALPGVAFGILVGQDRSLGLHDCRAGEVLAGDQFDVLLLAQTLVLDHLGDRRIHKAEFEIAGGIPGFHFVNPPFMAPALEAGVEKSFHDLARGVGRSGFSGQAKHIRVVVLARHLGRGFIRHQRRPHPSNLVGGHRHSDARGANENPRPRLSFRPPGARPPGHSRCNPLIRSNGFPGP